MKIALMGDLHYSVDFNDSTLDNKENINKIRDRFYTEYLDSYFEIDADMYISVGDLTNMGHQLEYQGIYDLINEHSEKKFRQVLGNHDLYASSRKEAEVYTKYIPNPVLSFPEIDLFFLETARDQDFTNYGGRVSNNQLEKLTDFLTQSSDKPVMIIGHHPIFDTTFGSNVDMWSIDSSLNLADIMSYKMSGPVFYVCGHNHADSIVQKENWSFIQLGAVLDYQSARLFEISESSSQISDCNFESAESRRMADQLAKQQEHFNLWPEAVGTTLNINKLFY